MNKSPEILVSIHCITYNHEPYIRQCLEGFVMQQTNFKFEAVVHDDASTDGTAVIIAEFAEKYPDIIKPLYEEENQYSKGGFLLINQLMTAHMRGKYIAICEGDDYWIDSCKLQKQVDFLELSPEYSMCFHKAKVIYDGSISMLYSSIEQREYKVSEILLKWLVPTCSVMFRGDIIFAMPSDKDFCLNDNVWFATCGRYGRLYCLRDKMSVYRQHQGVSNGLSYRILIKHWVAHSRHLPEYTETTLGIASFLYASEVMILIKKLDIECFSYYKKACKDIGVIRFTYDFYKVISKSLVRNIYRLLGIHPNLASQKYE